MRDKKAEIERAWRRWKRFFVFFPFWVALIVGINIYQGQDATGYSALEMVGIGVLFVMFAAVIFGAGRLIYRFILGFYTDGKKS